MQNKKTGKITNLLTVPSPEQDDGVVNLADWVEIKALVSSDGKASSEDLARGLQRAYSISDQGARDAAAAAFKELADRYTSCVDAQGRPGGWVYPFRLNSIGNVLSLRTGHSRRSKSSTLYFFLLVATRSDMDAQRKLNGLDPTVIFERLCADVLLNFWGGKSEFSGSLVFGTARKRNSGTGAFRANVKLLCSQLREGGGLKPNSLGPGAGDGKLDIVAWRIFADGRSGGLVGFGQCKTGIHWKAHLTKLQPRAFCQKYFQNALILDPIRVYMVPHRVDGRQWNDHSLMLGFCLIVVV